MNKIKLLAAAAVIASFALAPATADARHVKSHVDTTMQNEYGYQKDMKGNNVIKKKKKKAHKKAVKKKKKKKNRSGTTPNECINPPCGQNYEH